MRSILWLKRTGMIYALAAAFMASCTAVGCPGCNGCQWLCRTWNKVFACTQICSAKIQFVNQDNGQNLSGVHDDAFVILRLRNTVTGQQIFSGRLNIHADGTTDEFQLDRCYNPCGDNLDTGQWALEIFGWNIPADDPSCGFGDCRLWGVGSGGSIVAVGWDDASCTPVVHFTLVPGPCGPC
jgi:hypothetical protein